MREQGIVPWRRPGLTRREFIAGLAAAGVVAGCSRSAAPGAHGDEAGAFPGSAPLYPDRYENWAGEFVVDGVSTFAPHSPEEVLAAANWAAQNGWTLRARGAMHNWSPLCLSPGSTADTPVVLADTLQFLNAMEMVEVAGQPAVRVEAGALMEDLLAFLETQGFGFTAVPAVGEISVGGALAIGGHGCAVPAAGEAPLPGQTYGSMSNRVLALTAVVWSASDGRYVLREFRRSDPEIGALLVCLGRAFITEVTLAVEPNQNLRCVSYVDIPARELFAPPGAGGRDIAGFLDTSGRIEALWYPFTDRPWLKVWTVSPQKPPTSRAVTGPYNYPFSDNYPDAITDLARQMVSGRPEAAPLFGQMLYAVTAAGLAATASFDLWGPSKNTMVFIRPTTLRVHEFSYAVLTRRDQVQRVVSDFAARYLELLASYDAQGRYPVNMPVEIRVTGLDAPGEFGGGAQTALLSALAPRPDRPDWNTAVWLSVLTLPGTPDMHAFFRELEQWLVAHYVGDYACVRPEWSKGWAYTENAAWSDAALLHRAIPDMHRAGRPADGGWDAAVGRLDALDRAGVFRPGFLAALLRA